MKPILLTLCLAVLSWASLAFALALAWVTGRFFATTLGWA